MSSIEAAPAILYQDPWLVAVDKPPGMPVQPDRTGDACLLHVVKDRFPAAALGSPHRLDRPVSGLVLFTLMPQALRGMDALFRGRAVEKTYLALVEGAPPPSGACRHKLMHAAGARKAAVQEADGQGRPVQLRFRNLAQGDRFALLEVKPQGGAFHQIRAQLAAIGHPIKGDVKYGARRGEPDRSIGLHAWRLAFAHPMDQRPLLLEAPVPHRSIWQALWRAAPGMT